MAFELLPLTPEQHTLTFVPRLSIELPFFNLTARRKDIPKVIKYQGRDDAGRPIRWEVYQDTSKEIGAPSVEAHEAWYLLVKPSIDSHRLPDGAIPEIIPLGGIRECLRMVGWTAGGHQAHELIKALTQISFAGCIADLWLPTGEHDAEGKERFLQIKGRFSRMSVYAIGEHHLTEEELAQNKFEFELEDVLYIRLDPLEAKLQQLQDRRILDNQYLFSISPAARRWYELMAAKIFGVVNNNGPFCEIRYSWYIKHHHTLKRQYARFRVVEQMKRVVKDHVDSGYISKVEYRAIKEPDQETDYIIRYYPGEGAKDSIARIQGHLHRKRNKSKLLRNASIPGPSRQATSVNANGSSDSVERTLITQKDAEDQQLISQLFAEFGIALNRALSLVDTRRESLIKQLLYWPHRKVEIKGGLAGWMIAAIERDYQPPPGYLEAVRRKSEVTAAETQRAKIAACIFCDGRGFREVLFTKESGHKTVRLCTHNPTIESPSERTKTAF
jgi:hypothetical protein